MKYLLLALLTLNAQAADFAEVKFIAGTAHSKNRPLKEGAKLHAGDVVVTGEKSYVRILMDGGIALQAGPKSVVTVTKDSDKTPLINLGQGYVLSRVSPTAKAEDKDRYRVKTKRATMGVRGTTFFAKEEANGDSLVCICEGKVGVKPKFGKEEIFTSKHHDEARTIGSDGKLIKAAMGSDHDDAQIAELEKLLKPGGAN